MKDKPIKGYYNEEGKFIEGKTPENRVLCHWSTDGEDCKHLATPEGYIWCEKHDKIMHQINGRKFKIDPEVKRALMKDE